MSQGRGGMVQAREEGNTKKGQGKGKVFYAHLYTLLGHHAHHVRPTNAHARQTTSLHSLEGVLWEVSGCGGVGS